MAKINKRTPPNKRTPWKIWQKLINVTPESIRFFPFIRVLKIFRQIMLDITFISIQFFHFPTEMNRIHEIFDIQPLKKSKFNKRTLPNKAVPPGKNSKN